MVVSTLLDFPFFLSYNRKEERRKKKEERRKEGLEDVTIELTHSYECGLFL